MSEFSNSRTRSARQSVEAFPIIAAWGFAPLRIAFRLPMLVLWTLGCYGALLCLWPVGLYSGERRRRWSKKVARTWLEVFPRTIGMRITAEGKPPAGQFFLVCNHISWVDFIAMNAQFDSRCVTMAEMGGMPFVGRIVSALNPIYVHRVRKDTSRVLGEITDALRAGESIHMAPEGVISPGREVRRFHAALLESAVVSRMPVHYASLTYRTPEGSPPPSMSVIFGPDPHYKTPEGRIPDSELEAWGPEKSFFVHLLGLLALPYHEIVVRFAARPIWAEDRFTLANNLQAAVQRIFTPVS